MNRMNKTRWIGTLRAATCGAVIALCGQAAHASLVEYGFTGNSFAPTSIDPLVVDNTSDLSVSAGASTSQFYGTSYSNTDTGTPAHQILGGWSEQLDPNRYWSFTVQPNAGYTLNLTSLTFYTSRNNDGINVWEVRSSLDGFNSTLGTGTGIAQGSPPAAWTFAETTLNMSNITGPVEFRIYGYSGNYGSGTGNGRIDDVTLNGAIAPEPATLALLGIGGLVMAAHRRHT